ncbi:MAG: prenyltransferase/squalene oxidase repeat-containing protein [Planctomycetota bacterium]|jgi:hypothetical protein
MKHLWYVLLLLLCLVLQPVGAQDDGGGEDRDDGTEIETAEDPPDDGFDEEEQRKKNEGLAGGGKRDDSDADAPKLKATLQQRVNEAIKKGVKWLKKRQGKNGSWGPIRANSIYGKPDVRGDFVRDETGPTSFAMFALAKCGVKKSDPVMKKGLNWLKGRAMRVHDVTGKTPTRDEGTHGQMGPDYMLTTYESASIIMMIEAIFQQSAKLTGKHKKRKLYSENPMRPPRGSRISKEDWRWMHDRVLHLTTGRSVKFGGSRGKKGSSRIPGCQNKNGGWRYQQANKDQDLSATQFVLLGLRAASQAGYPIDRVAPNTWKYAANYIRSMQSSEGAFRYQKGKRWTAAMDACGIASLVICREQMELQSQPIPEWMNTAIKKGLGHLDQVFTAKYNQGGSHHYYFLYGVERVGDLTGRKVFNGKDWYFRGAEFLIEAQQDDGKWVDQTAFGPPRDVLGTCYALLFLKRATIPTITTSEKSEDQ